MSRAKDDKTCGVYTAVVIASGICLWSVAMILFALRYAWQDQLIVLALVPLIVVTGLFPNNFPLPSILKASREKLTFTLSDAIILLVAYRYGLAASIFIAGIEGYTSSRYVVRRLTSNLFSMGMMSHAAAAAGLTLAFVIGLGGSMSGSVQRTFSLVAVALVAASITHIIVNTCLISTLFALRNHDSILKSWKANLFLAVPMFLPTGAAASLMYISLQYEVWLMVVIGVPLLLAIFFGHRQYRNSIQERISSLEKAHHELVEALAVAINAKDEVTHEHVLRVQIYSAGVARLLGCSESEVDALKAGALLHDIGKIAVPDYILNKPGKLTSSEFDKMKMHTLVGAQILERVEFPYPVVPVVRHHHERWDGKGYPDSLAGEDIPLTARILSVVDCFDAVREDRQYRKGMTREQAIDFLMTNSGTQYDPQVVGTFVTHLPEFEAEIRAYRDAPMPTFGIRPVEQLSKAAQLVEPAAGLEETMTTIKEPKNQDFSFEELRALYKLVQALHGATERDQIVTAFVERLGDVVPYECSTVILADANSGDCEITHASGEHAASLIGRKIVPGEGVSGWVVANRHPFCNTDPKLDLPPSISDRFHDYRTLAVFPILKGDDLFGAVALYSSSLAKYDTTHQRLLGEATGLLALALSAISEVIPVAAWQQTKIEDSPKSRGASLKNSPYSPMPIHAPEHSP